MASTVDICNMAMSHIGQGVTISSIDPPDGTVEAGYCATFYPSARAAAIESGAWSFARKRIELAPTTNPSSVWQYAYAMPSDCLRPLRVLPLASVSVFELYLDSNLRLAPTEASSASFSVEGDLLLTNEPDAVLYYLRDITDSAKFTTLFTIGLSYMLASMVAGQLVGGERGEQKAASLLKQAFAWLARADALDGNSSDKAATTYVASHLQARR